MNAIQTIFTDTYVYYTRLIRVINVSVLSCGFLSFAIPFVRMYFLKKKKRFHSGVHTSTLRIHVEKIKRKGRREEENKKIEREIKKKKKKIHRHCVHSTISEMECTIACHVEGMLSKVSNLISFHRSIRIRKLMISEWLVWHLCMYDIRACLRLRRDGRRKLILLSPLRSWTPMQTGFPLTPLTSLIPRISWTLEKGTLLRHQIHRMKFALNWKGWENLIQFSIILFYFFFLLFFSISFSFWKELLERWISRRS